jgi:hypothetical protein
MYGSAKPRISLTSGAEGFVANKSDNEVLNPAYRHPNLTQTQFLYLHLPAPKSATVLGYYSWLLADQAKNADVLHVVLWLPSLCTVA